VGRDKGSLTEQQTKGTVKIMIQIRRIHNTNSRTQRATLTAHRRHALPSCECLRTARLPPIRTQHDSTRYGIPCSDWPGRVSPPGCVPSWLWVKINPVVAEPRTDTTNGDCFSHLTQNGLQIQTFPCGVASLFLTKACTSNIIL